MLRVGIKFHLHFSFILYKRENFRIFWYLGRKFYFQKKFFFTSFKVIFINKFYTKNESIFTNFSNSKALEDDNICFIKIFLKIIIKRRPQKWNTFESFIPTLKTLPDTPAAHSFYTANPQIVLFFFSNSAQK